MNFLKRHKKLFIAAVAAICLIAALVTVDDKYKPGFVKNAIGFVVTPIQSVCTNVGRWFGDRIDSFVHMADMEKENRLLKKENEELKSENIYLKEVDKENDELNALLKIKRKYNSYETEGASIIGKDPGAWYNNFVIDKGSKDGLKEDMVVLASGGLVGVIFEVGYNFSKVRSVIDETSSVSVKSSRTDDIGILRGDATLMLEGKCRMVYISPEAEMPIGEEIVTSHLSEKFPPGLIIGEILEVKTDPIGTKYAIVEPFVDFMHLETVLVITEVFEREP